MYEIDLKKDIWPFIKFMTVGFVGYGIGTPKEIVEEWHNITRFDPSTNFSALGSPLRVSWGISYGKNMARIVLSGEGNNLLMFGVSRLNTKADVLLKGYDVLYFIDPDFNPMLREERDRKIRAVRIRTL